jgi:hypothetical protein
VLVGVDKVVVRRIVQEDEAKSDGTATECRPGPVDVFVGCPGEDEDSDGDEPAGEHHGNESGFCGRMAVMLRDEGHVVLVHQWCARSGQKHANDERNEHESGASCAEALACLSASGLF